MNVLFLDFKFTRSAAVSSEKCHFPNKKKRYLTKDGNLSKKITVFILKYQSLFATFA